MLADCYKQVLKNWFGKEKSERPFIDKVIEVLENYWNDKNVFVIEAPTGYGKSTISAAIALFSLKSKDSLKCIVAFPLRTLLEDQYCKFVGEYEEDEEPSCEGKRSILGEVEQNLRLSVVGKRYMHNPNSVYLIKPITLTTIDTLSLTLFGIPPENLDKVVREWDGTIGGSLGHYLFSWSSVVLSNIVLDEVHLLADSTKSLSFLVALMKIAIDFNQKLVLMSATLPDSLKSLIIEYTDKLNFANKLCMINFSPSDGGCVEKSGEVTVCTGWDDAFVRDRGEKEYEVILEKVKEEDKLEKILTWLRENKEFRRAIVIFNTAREAIEFYDSKLNELRKLFGENVVLLHSRFTEKDREKKIGELRKLSDAYLIVSTQIIEAGIDISSNLFITDIAPANSLIQRLGRFLRYPHKDDEGYENPAEKKGKIIIWYEAREDGKLKTTIESEEKKTYKVYDYDLTLKTLEWLEENSEQLENKRVVKINVHVPEISSESRSSKRGYRDLLNYVYDEERRDEYFKVDEETIRDFEGIFLHLENASLIAIEKFFEMEGSFVREGLQIPVVPEAKVSELKSDSGFINEKVADFVRKFVVPVDANRFRGENKPEIYGVVVAEKEGEILKPKFIEKSSDDWLMSIVEEDIRPRSLLRYIFAKDVLAFVVDAEYRTDLGLIFKKEVEK